MRRLLLFLACLLFGVAILVDGVVRLVHMQTKVQASWVGLELSAGFMMLLLGGLALLRKGLN
jgi:hypothetical protein